jgi:hypothetical protein
MSAWHLQARGPGWELRDNADQLVGRLSEIEPRHARWIAASRLLLLACRDLLIARRDAGNMTDDERQVLDQIHSLLSNASRAS